MSFALAGINSKYIAKCLLFFEPLSRDASMSFFHDSFLGCPIMVDIAVWTFCLASWVLVVGNFKSLFSIRFVLDSSFVNVLPRSNKLRE